MKRIALVVAILLLLAMGYASAAPTQWPVAAGGNGHYYEKVYSDANWPEAQVEFSRDQ
ncbi:MAG: hypothetical protein GX808_05365 [Syntrophomonadaceae bacterium]|nr:hypothetical protein [Syntrophomonadaceae bacterium]